MPDINTESMAIVPGVVETIVTLAVRDVAGVASVCRTFRDPFPSFVQAVRAGRVRQRFS